MYATYTGHIFDTTLDIYFAEARFYDANTRTWLAMDPIKDGDNWYQYCYSSPVVYYDPDGRIATAIIVGTVTKFVVGATVSGIASVIGQAVNYDKENGKINVDFGKVDISDVVVDSLSGGVSSVLPFTKGAKIAADVAIGVGGQTVKNVIHKRPFYEDTISAGLSAGAGSALSSWLIPETAFKTSDLPGPKLANPTRSLGGCCDEFLFKLSDRERYCEIYHTEDSSIFCLRDTWRRTYRSIY